MTKSPPNAVKIGVSLFGGLGYFSVLLQYLWLAVVFLPAILQNQTFKNIFLSTPIETQPVHQTTLGAAQSPWVMVSVALITLIMIVVTIYLIVKIPKIIATSGTAMTKHAVDAAIPVVTHYKKVSAKRKKALTFRLSFAIKLMFVVLAYSLLFLPVTENVLLEKEVIWFVGTILVSGSVFWIGIQYALAKIFSLPPEKIL